tara:strand:+ start:6721 stop:7851 length:1131 start_codon:yes stop_codon:yes gene_type:complete
MSEDEPKTPGSLVAITDVFGLGSLSKSVISALQKTIATLYRPVAIRNEGGALLELGSRATIDGAKARAEADAILAQSASELEKLRSLEDRKNLANLERQADVVTEGLARATELNEAGQATRDAPPEWMDLFLDMAERIDDAGIRGIWAEILAREVTEGRRRMSLHTLDSMRFLEAHHARLFDAYARTFLVFGRCWRDGFDSTFGKATSSLLGRSDAHNDFRALAEMGFVEILPGNTPDKGRSTALNFHRFAARITPLNTTFNLQEVRPTMRGEELMRVVLGLEGDREDLSVGRFAKNAALSYEVLDPERQAMVLRRWFQYLFNETFRVEVGVFGPGRNFMNTDWQFVWEKGGLVPAEAVQVAPDVMMPPEITALLK